MAVASKREKEETVIVDNCHCSSEGGGVSTWSPRRKGGRKRWEKKGFLSPFESGDIFSWGTSGGI